MLAPKNIEHPRHRGVFYAPEGYNESSMNSVMAVVGVGVFVALILVRSLRPARSRFSVSELRRREVAGDKAAGHALRREELLPLVQSFRPYIEAVLLAMLTALLIFLLGQARGVATSLLAIPFYIQLARVPAIGRLSNALFAQRETKIYDMLYKKQRIWITLFGRSHEEAQGFRVGSREELLDLIETANHAVLGEGDKKLLMATASFHSRRVSDIMTPREDIVSVHGRELLGPLVLDDLHKSGHSCFPVVQGDIDTVIGVLDISNLVTLEVKRSVSAAKAMTPKVLYIRGDETLSAALDTLVRAKSHLLIVVDKDGKTAGLVSLGDIIAAMTGQNPAR